MSEQWERNLVGLGGIRAVGRNLVGLGGIGALEEKLGRCLESEQWERNLVGLGGIRAVREKLGRCRWNQSSGRETW